MKIGEAAKETGLSVSNIRFYEKKGLLSPKRREESQYREYGPEDVRRLKEIVLLRKMGLPVESIYLLYEGKVGLNGLMRRQQETLQEQMETLEGALKLCRLLEHEETIETVDVDSWLNYVHEEEEKGQRFARAEELLEDLAEFSKMASFRYDPYVGRFFRNRWTARILAVLVVVSLLAAAYSMIFGGNGHTGRAIVWFWAILLLGYGFNFIYYRRWKHRNDREDER